MRTLLKDLISTGVLAEKEGAFVFMQDHAFNSPSAASAVVLGRNSNGREAWKTDTGVTLKELQSAATRDAASLIQEERHDYDHH